MEPEVQCTTVSKKSQAKEHVHEIKLETLKASEIEALIRDLYNNKSSRSKFTLSNHPTSSTSSPSLRKSNGNIQRGFSTFSKDNEENSTKRLTSPKIIEDDQNFEMSNASDTSI